MYRGMVSQELVAIIDRSGSMHGKVADTVGGINAAFDEVKKSKNDEDVIHVSVKLFDHEESVLIRRKNIKEVQDLKECDFVPRGSTALRDAMGNTLMYFMELKLIEPNAYDSCVIYVATDGLENASTHFSSQRLGELIKNAKEKYNIEVLYLGANQDAILEAGKIGICKDNAINYNECTENVDAVYRGVAASASRMRSSNGVGFLSAERQSSVRLPSSDRPSTRRGPKNRESHSSHGNT